ncbi:UV-damaged DNA-binding protein rad7 [Dipsacomyces acuminosporus]|nr:UV-damaged DNA-binding protein rad7 [Dipsacomyces acuminosporus]
MDPNDRGRRTSRRGANDAANSAGPGNRIRGPQSALTDYLNEIGVSEHFRERRRREARERRVQGQGDTDQQQAAEPAQEGINTADVRLTTDSYDAALAADVQQEQVEAVNAESSASAARRIGTRSSTRSASAAASAASATAAAGTKKQQQRKKKKRRGADDDDDDSERDEAEYAEGLNKSSARKGGHFELCELCNKRFLVRGGNTPARLLCPACRKSVEKSQNDKDAVAKRARATVALGEAKRTKRRKMKKTADGLLEFEPGLPSLQDLCVRVIAKHIDQVESFGDLTAQSLNKLCRIISKMRVLDEQTMSLFLGPDKSSVTLYDCTRITDSGMAKVVDLCPNVEVLKFAYCGRLNDGNILDFASRLSNLTSVSLDGAFLVTDQGWAHFFRAVSARLMSFKVRWTGFGIKAMRALVTHCTELRELRISECHEFDDDCLALLAAPITEYEEIEQEHERLLKVLSARNRKGKHKDKGKGKGKGKGSDTASADESTLGAFTGPIPAWQPLSKLQKLDLSHPHKPMMNQTMMRVVRALGPQLKSLDVSGFKDLEDDFLANVLAEHCYGLHELGLGECNSISPEAFVEFFSRCRRKQTVPGRGFVRLSLDRCYMLTDAVIQEIMLHSGTTLTSLGLNSVDDSLSKYGILALAGHVYKLDNDGSNSKDNDNNNDEPELVDKVFGCPYLEELDLSWVRCTTDAVLEEIVGSCKRLSQIRVYGCPHVTQFAPARPGLKYTGRESDTI